jgi:hypothetical protein
MSFLFLSSVSRRLFDASQSDASQSDAPQSAPAADEPHTRRDSLPPTTIARAASSAALNSELSARNTAPLIAPRAPLSSLALSPDGVLLPVSPVVEVSQHLVGTMQLLHNSLAVGTQIHAELVAAQAQLAQTQREARCSQFDITAFENLLKTLEAATRSGFQPRRSNYGVEVVNTSPEIFQPGSHSINDKFKLAFNITRIAENFFKSKTKENQLDMAAASIDEYRVGEESASMAKVLASRFLSRYEALLRPHQTDDIPVTFTGKDGQWLPGPHASEAHLELVKRPTRTDRLVFNTPELRNDLILQILKIKEIIIPKLNEELKTIQNCIESSENGVNNHKRVHDWANQEFFTQFPDLPAAQLAHALTQLHMGPSSTINPA